MKYKLISLLLIILFVINLVASANPISDNNKENKTTFFDDPAPTWNVGNTWTYTINSFVVDYQYSNLKLYMSGRIDDLKLSVSSTAGSDYVVNFNGEITANSYEIELPFASRIIRITGSIKPSLTSLSGTIVFTKSDLEIKDITAKIQGLTAAKIYPIPIPFPIPFKITLDDDLSTVFPLFDFPLSSNKFWNLPSITITSKITLAGILGIFKYPITLQTTYSWTPLAFHCKTKKDVTVAAGTFNAYEISSTFFDIFEYYYAPSVGSLVKIDATMSRGQVHGELKSYNFP